MLRIIEIVEGGFHSDRVVELINYCVARDGAGEKRELSIRDARIGALMGVIPGH